MFARRMTSGAWRSPVARLLWEQEVPGSNPGAPILQRETPSVLSGWRGFVCLQVRFRWCQKWCQIGSFFGPCGEGSAGARLRLATVGGLRVEGAGQDPGDRLRPAGGRQRRDFSYLGCWGPRERNR